MNTASSSSSSSILATYHSVSSSIFKLSDVDFILVHPKNNFLIAISDVYSSHKSVLTKIKNAKSNLSFSNKDGAMC